MLSGYTRDHKSLAEVVAEFAYPICANPYLGFCYKCDPSWVGWICPVCDFPLVQEEAYMQMASIEDISGYEPTGESFGRGSFGRADINEWQRLFASRGGY